MAISLSSRRAVLRRFASLGIARHIAFTRRPAIQRKDLLCTTQRTPQLGSGHLNDSQRDFAYCDAPQFNARICLLLFASRHGATLRGSVRRSAALRNATLRFVCYNATPLCAAPRHSARLLAALRNATICLLLRDATWLIASLRSSAQLNDLFVTSPRLEPQLYSTSRSVTLCYSTICLSIYYRASTRLSATNRGATRLAATRSNSTQRFVYQFILRIFALRLSTRLVSARCDAPLRNATQRNELKLN